jgi:Tfp pilus assembly protein PilF
MRQSRCFQGGRGPSRLGCVSCHDPHVHVGPERRQAHYRERCLKCHQPQNCSAPAADRRGKEDSCIDCHLPRQGSYDVAHTAVTDHRIRRRPAPPGAEPTPPALRGLLPVVLFDREAAAPPDGEASRDLGIALVALMAQDKLDRGTYADRALPLLEAATRRDPGDVEAWQARADALVLLRRPAEALRAVEAALPLGPQRETLLARAGQLTQDLGDGDAAVGYWRRAVAANPWLAEYRGPLAELLARRGAWDEARVQCRDWLRLDPESVPARLLWIRCLLHDGNRRAARAEADRVAALQPEYRDRLEAWFAEQAGQSPGR